MIIAIHHHHHLDSGLCSRLEEGVRLLREVRNLLHSVIQKEDQIMATLADLQAAVTAENSVIDSAITLIEGLAAAVKALPPDQAAIDALAAEVQAKAVALAAAVAANPVPTPAPAP